MKTAHFIFAGVLAAALLLGGCAADTPEPTATPSETQPLAETTAPTQETTTPTEPPQETTALLDDLFVVNNQTVVYNGQVIARGDASLVRDLTTNEPVGYTLCTITPHPDAPEDPYLYEDFNWQYDLYQKDGTFWQDCGSLQVSGVLGDWFYGWKDNSYNFVATKTPTDPESYISVKMRQQSPGRCFIWNAPQEFLGFTGIALVDEQLNILNRFETDSACSYVSHDSPVDYFKLEDGGIVDAQTMELLPFQSFTTINDGYMLFQTMDGLYDLKDRDGNPVITGNPNKITFYNDHVRIEVYQIEKPSPQEVSYGILSGRQATYIYIDGVLTQSGESIYASRWNGGFYVRDRNSDKLTIYGLNGQILAEHDPEKYGDARYASCESDILYLNFGETYQYWISDTPSVQFNSADEFTHFFRLTYDNESLPRFALLHQFSGEHSDYVYDLWDEEGNLVKAGFSELRSSGYPNVYCATRGLSTGLIDQNGDWLWKESIFAADPD